MAPSTFPAPPAPLPASADVATLLPGYDATKASALIDISYASTACGMGGFTVTIDGHPEATVTYWTAGSQSAGKPDKTLTSAPGKNSEGLISVTGINPAAPAPFKITVIGASGCTFSTDGLMPDGRTGKVPFEAGAVSCIELRG